MTARLSIHVGGSLLLALALSACQAGDDAQTPGSAPNPDPAESRSGEETTEGNLMSESEHLSLDEAVEAAREDLSGRAGTTVEDITVVRAQKVTWADGARGCPQDGMMYTQALVEGYFILLRADGEESAYHAGRDGQPFHCPSERSNAPPPSGEAPLS